MKSKGLSDKAIRRIAEEFDYKSTSTCNNLGDGGICLEALKNGEFDVWEYEKGSYIKNKRTVKPRDVCPFAGEPDEGMCPYYEPDVVDEKMISGDHTFGKESQMSDDTWVDREEIISDTFDESVVRATGGTIEDIARDAEFNIKSFVDDVIKGQLEESLIRAVTEFLEELRFEDISITPDQESSVRQIVSNTVEESVTELLDDWDQTGIYNTILGTIELDLKDRIIEAVVGKQL